MEESTLLENETNKLAEREIEHLSNTVRFSLGIDDLTIIDTLKNLNKIRSINYAYIYDGDNNIVSFAYVREKEIIEPEGNTGLGEIYKKAIANKNTEKPLLIKYEDPDDTSGQIYDFSIASEFVVDRHHRKFAISITTPRWHCWMLPELSFEFISPQDPCYS